MNCENNAYLYVYQYKDYLGNVQLSYADLNGDGIIRPEEGEILDSTDYYPFGLMHKTYETVYSEYANEEAEKYKFGQKEWQDELDLNVFDYGARLYDPALGRFFVLDLFSELYSDKTPYHYVSNNPINKIDIQGHFEIDVKDQKKYKVLTNYLKNGIGEILNSPTIMNGLQKYGGFSEQQVKEKIVNFGKGSIKLEIVNDLPFGANGYYMGGKDRPIQIAQALVEQIENATYEEERELAILSFLITALHEGTHYGNWTFDGFPSRESFEFIDNWGFPVKESEVGIAFEIATFWDGKITDYNGAKRGKEGMNAMKQISRNKMTSGKLRDLPKGLQNIIKTLKEENPEIELFIIE